MEKNVLMKRPEKMQSKKGKFLITAYKDVNSLIFAGFRVATKKEKKLLLCVKDICKKENK